MDNDPGELLLRLNHIPVESLFDYLEETQFWIKDAKGRYMRVNRVFQLDYSLASPEDAVGLTDDDLSPAWIAEAFRADDARVLMGQRIVNRIELVSGPHKAFRWFRTNKVPLCDESGEIVAIAGMARLLPGLRTPAFPVPELARPLEAMQKDPQESWTNGELAKLAGLSVSTFERRFRKHLHSSPMQFLKKLRLSRAVEALTLTIQPISVIALDCGFSDQAHLARDFKKT
jgi:AraC-like DNA-binding protein